MPVLDALAAYLQIQGQGMPGEDIFLSRLPDGPGSIDRCAALIEYQGTAPEFTHDISGIAYNNARVQLTVRDAPSEYAAARAWAETINQALARIVNQTLSGVFYLAVIPLSEPFLMRRDELDRPIIASNFSILKAPG